MLFTHSRAVEIHSDLPVKIHSLFKNAGWNVVLKTTDLVHHSEGVRIIGGAQRERGVVAWALSTLGVSAQMDDPNGAPMLQIVVGEAEPMTVETVKNLLDSATAERDEAIAALKDKKHEYAMEVVERYSNIRAKDGEPQPTVTVRYASYGQDYELAQKIRDLFTQYVRWHVDLETSNKPALPRADKFKVLFDVGMTYFTYGPLIHAISEGDLLGVPVGRLQFVEREDSHHLIVMVCPSVGAEPIKADPA
jgi:hypothetical protein